MASPLQLSIVNFNKNSYIIVEGKQKADYFYILRSGKVRISKEVEVVEEEGQEVAIAHLPTIDAKSLKHFNPLG